MSIFDRASLQEDVHRALVEANVPADDDNAFVLVATTGGGVRGVLAVKVKDMWQIDTVLAYKKGEGIDAGIAVKASWKN